MRETTHISVLKNEALQQLEVKPKHWCIDATFGRGGHTKEILNQGAAVIAFDWDEEAISTGKKAFEKEIAAGKLILVRESFGKLGETIGNLRQKNSHLTISAVLYDFGTSTEQLTSSERGFSFEGDGYLDMRMDTRLGVTAADILAAVSESQLAQLLKEYGDESDAKKIARAVKRSSVPITTTGQLSQLISNIKRQPPSRIHPATKTFQAIRIAVNSELEEIEKSLPQALEVLEPKGRIVTIAFHRGEDKLAKTMFKTWQDQGFGTTLDLIRPTDEETTQNPRSRSAKLRVFIKN